MKPARGGVARLPAPHPMKKREESRPVTFTFLATHEKQEPNCQDTKNPYKGHTIKNEVFGFDFYNFFGVKV